MGFFFSILKQKSDIYFQNKLKGAAVVFLTLKKKTMSILKFREIKNKMDAVGKLQVVINF